MDKPSTSLPLRTIEPNDGWCDDPTHLTYNNLVTLPHDGTCERLWRNDGIYDVVVEVGYNDCLPIPGRGSAIFLHIAGDAGLPTNGCIALAVEDLL